MASIVLEPRVLAFHVITSPRVQRPFRLLSTALGSYLPIDLSRRHLHPLNLVTIGHGHIALMRTLALDQPYNFTWSLKANISPTAHIENLMVVFWPCNTTPLHVHLKTRSVPFLSAGFYVHQCRPQRLQNILASCCSRSCIAGQPSIVTDHP
ncbi:hypothetical protein BS50DRAFT_324582 [Corynespora cassiicola Philippines]|uniref:Uncharacterized protein n=1 Tax=Corynespora cassiicola Philippines TaxID=1448308 RepID=A0A2T2NTN4_CORCC|nr:hypothetical protein BS50DRAFT_324582 [Corynespora cassiicola Philippines]